MSDKPESDIGLLPIEASGIPVPFIDAVRHLAACVRSDSPELMEALERVEGFL